jgi:hypothetical protein
VSNWPGLAARMLVWRERIDTQLDKLRSASADLNYCDFQGQNYGHNNKEGISECVCDWFLDFRVIIKYNKLVVNFKIQTYKS